MQPTTTWRFRRHAVQRDLIFPTPVIQASDVFIGLPSSGTHSNGFSLVRQVAARSDLLYSDTVPWNKDTRSENPSLHHLDLHREAFAWYANELGQEYRPYHTRRVRQEHSSSVLLWYGTRMHYRCLDMGSPGHLKMDQGGWAENIEMARTFKMGSVWVLSLPRAQGKCGCRARERQEFKRTRSVCDGSHHVNRRCYHE